MRSGLLIYLCITLPADSKSYSFPHNCCTVHILPACLSVALPSWVCLFVHLFFPAVEAVFLFLPAIPCFLSPSSYLLLASRPPSWRLLPKSWSRHGVVRLRYTIRGTAACGKIPTNGVSPMFTSEPNRRECEVYIGLAARQSQRCRLSCCATVPILKTEA